MRPVPNSCKKNQNKPLRLPRCDSAKQHDVRLAPFTGLGVTITGLWGYPVAAASRAIRAAFRVSLLRSWSSSQSRSRRRTRAGRKASNRQASALRGVASPRLRSRTPRARQLATALGPSLTLLGQSMGAPGPFSSDDDEAQLVADYYLALNCEGPHFGPTGHVRRRLGARNSREGQIQRHGVSALRCFELTHDATTIGAS
jgi:hypothetical protein